MRIIPITEAQFALEKGPAWEKMDGPTVFQSGGGGKFGRVVHIMYLDDAGNNTFDGMLRAEPGGALFLPIDSEGRIGLQKRERPQTNLTAEDWKADYANGQIDYDSLGRPSWEIPRGYGELNENGEQTARREAEEETGGTVVRQQVLGWVNDNTAITPHMTLVSFGKIDTERPSGRAEDPFEKMLTGVTFFTRSQLKELIKRQELYCCMTLAAIAQYDLLHG